MLEEKNKMIKITDKYLKIDTATTSMVLEITRNLPQLLYYGKKLRDADDYCCFLPSYRGKPLGSNSDADNDISVISSNGQGNQKECFAIIKKDGVFTNRFTLTNCEITDGFNSPLPTARNKGQTVCLTYIEKVSGATLKQYYTVFDGSDVIAAHSEIINTSAAVVKVNRLMSLQLDFLADRAEISSFDGQWLFERTRHDTVLTAGRYENSSVVGISSSEHNPFIAVKVNGLCLGFNLIWSGNHKELVEVSPYGRVRILTGMNDYALEYPLEPSQRLVSPEAIVVCADSEEKMTTALHKFSLDHIISPAFAYKDRPVLINNWEGTYFNFTGDKIYEMAKKASECGIEMFVLDDGWFGARDNDLCGLGDWFDNVKKTGGLKNLANKIKSLGMKFGLWVEPEMICRDSDLFRMHPEYAQIIPGVEPLERRHQLCIDLCNDEVVDYLADTLIALFKDVGVDYVKWDHNRSMSDVFSSKLKDQGRYFYDYYKNQTELLRRITEACPNVLFESCASGGCRYDLGMQYFMPQNWGSDNTNAYSRLFIQEGTLTAYPQSTMGSHVAAIHSVPSVHLESRFNVASVGAFGYELDITKMSEEELSTVCEQVKYYKQHRHLLQYGNYYRLGQSLLSADIGGWMVVSDDKNEAIATVVSKNEGGGMSPQFVSFKGLDKETLYEVTSRKQTNYDNEIKFKAYGDALMNGCLDFGVLPRNEKNSLDYSARFSSRMFFVKKV